ncbi:hypothetical protein DHEL01_v203985 [Diaporthe helianthi]|uniref:Uncharacterized protein n=1 Tax=Diaporthe helianthi TaxID=158607 RepID=A0A2P5I565_DIAHE|nr:hypothetical protein DHEL01_v203985 [Diaporthe helianthi]
MDDFDQTGSTGTDPAKFECVYHTTCTLLLPGNVPPVASVDVAIGRVVAVYNADDVLTDRILGVQETQPIALCGLQDRFGCYQ